MKPHKNSAHDDFLLLFDKYLIANGEKIKNKGEDAYGYFFNENGGMIAVFDGCGGLGSRKYEKFSMNSGAYIASREAGKALRNWFQDFSSKGGRINDNTAEIIKKELYAFLCKRLSDCNSDIAVSGIKGSMTRDFPTTVSAILFDYWQGSLSALFLWAGDSRGYVMTTEGLLQVTKDDLAGEEDAFLNLYNDAKLENVVSADGKFVINDIVLQCPYPAVFVSATDGCFGYFSTPMEFEYMLLDTLTQSNCIIEWETALKEYMGKYAGDDYTLAIAAFGYGDFSTLKSSFLDRHKHMYQKYISKIANSEKEDLRKMWNEYKEFYYAVLRQGDNNQ